MKFPSENVPDDGTPGNGLNFAEVLAANEAATANPRPKLSAVFAQNEAAAARAGEVAEGQMGAPTPQPSAPERMLPPTYYVAPSGGEALVNAATGAPRWWEIFKNRHDFGDVWRFKPLLGRAMLADGAAFDLGTLTSLVDAAEGYATVWQAHPDPGDWAKRLAMVRKPGDTSGSLFGYGKFDFLLRVVETLDSQL